MCELHWSKEPKQRTIQRNWLKQPSQRHLDAYSCCGINVWAESWLSEKQQNTLHPLPPCLKSQSLIQQAGTESCNTENPLPIISSLLLLKGISLQQSYSSDDKTMFSKVSPKSFSLNYRRQSSKLHHSESPVWSSKRDCILDEKWRHHAHLIWFRYQNWSISIHHSCSYKVV